MKEFNLSVQNQSEAENKEDEYVGWYFKKDVKEFIKIILGDLKKEGEAGVEDFDEDVLAFSLRDIKNILKKRAGKELSK